MSKQAKHLAHDLRQMQSLPLEAKIIMTQQRIQQWVDYWNDDVYVSFSGGKDSTVLKHIVDGMYSHIPALFVNTGLEYPEIQKFVFDIKKGKYPCFNSDVEIVRPEMRFDEVIKKYGYPVPSKDLSRKIYYARRGAKWAMKFVDGTAVDAQGRASRFSVSKRFLPLMEAPFEVSPACCDVMKKKPAKKYEKETGKKPMLATMADESALRYQSWLKHGCNAFQSDKPKSQPMSFWTEQDVLHYIKKYDVPYCSVYGDIQLKQTVDNEKVFEGQMNVIDYLECYEPEDALETTGCNRTGCVYCMFGITQDKRPNRFQRLKETHPRQWEYCIGGGEMVEGKWQPNQEGLGLGKVLDYIGVEYE